MAVKVSRAVYDGLMAVRATGRTNMLDRPMVQVIANELELYETVVWLEDNRSLYARGIFEGFEPEVIE